MNMSTDHESDNQLQTSQLYEKPDWKVIDVDFLSSYYVQDGNHSPVTGGIGTEYLTDFTQKIIVSAPLSAKTTLLMDAGYDYYTSASTDNINNIPSSASSKDMRVHGNIGMNYMVNDNHSVGVRVGGSGEYDYNSIQGGLNYQWISDDENTAIGLSAQAFIDQWILYYPVELRRQGRLVPTDKRQSYNIGLSYSKVLNKKMQLSLMVEGVKMNGLLSTPFHRVFFNNESLPKVEQLPGSRLKIPIGIRLNTYLTEKIISRMYYRYYWDDWGVKAHTMSIELPYKINRFFSIFPFYRYHTQSAADYFAPYGEHTLDQTYYTSDYDLAQLSSHSYGAGLSYAPAGGITKMKVPFTKKGITMKSIDLKYSHYTRSPDLRADIVSLGISFSIK